MRCFIYSVSFCLKNKEVFECEVFIVIFIFLFIESSAKYQSLETHRSFRHSPCSECVVRQEQVLFAVVSVVHGAVRNRGRSFIAGSAGCPWALSGLFFFFFLWLNFGNEECNHQPVLTTDNTIFLLNISMQRFIFTYLRSIFIGTHLKISCFQL
jgi:hypothetical protein